MGQSHDKYNTIGMLGMLAGARKTIGEAMDVVSRYNDTLSGVMQYRYHVFEKEATFEIKPIKVWETTNLESARQAVDLSISGWLTAIQEVGQRKIYPLRTELKYDKRYEKEYKKVLKSPVEFNMPINQMVFRKEDMDTPLISYDPTLITAFEHLINEKKKQYDSGSTVA